MYYKIINGTEYVSIYRAAVYFNISKATFKRNLEAVGINIVSYKNIEYMLRSDFEDTKKNDMSMIGFRKILYECICENSDITVNFLKPENYNKYRELYSYIRGMNYFGTSISNSLVSRTYSPIEFFVHQDDIEQFKEKVIITLKLYNKTKDQKFRILLGDEFFNINKKTKSALIDLKEKKTARAKSGINELANFLRLTCQNELCEYTDDELHAYMNFATESITKNANVLLSDLICIISQKEKECSFSQLMQFDEYANVLKRDSSAYEDTVYIKLAYMIFNEEYWIEKDMIAKAVSSKTMATTWLYHAMQFVSAWRTVDIRVNMPHITLNHDPHEIIRMIKDYDFNDNTWMPYANELCARISFENEEPHKTKRYSNIPNLKLYIPESFRSTIGMLLALCEAHSIIEGKGRPICKFPHNKNYPVLLFGQEYKSLLNDKYISNQKANKSFMDRIMEIGDKKYGNGFLIAAYARSHKGGLGSLPKVTSKYLNAKMDGKSIVDVMKVIFERGVCSFVPYLLCYALYDEFEKQDIHKQTKTIKKLGMIPYDIELLLNIDEKVIFKARQTMAELIRNTNEDNAKDFISNILNEIAAGKCVGKNEDVYCLIKASGKECPMTKRENCIGCGQEMYLKTFLQELNSVLISDSIKYKTSITKAEKFKWNSILEEKLYPAVYEILSAIKYIYKQDVEEYKNIFLGDVLYGDACLDQPNE